MSADKRSVHTDALETLGTILTAPQGRDAIHLAVEQVTAGQLLAPGMDIKRGSDGRYIRATANDGIGIVDPFIRSQVYEGDSFWLVVYPRMISSLRHVWTHPDFDDVEHDIPVIEEVKPIVMTADQREQEIEASKQWIRDYAASFGRGHDDYYGYDDYGSIDYDDLMDHAMTWVNPGTYGGDYLTRGGLLEGESTDPEFWKHFTIITGKTPAHDKYYGDTPSFFSCSC